MQPEAARNQAARRPATRALPRHWEWLALAVIALAAFALRAWTAQLNLPFVDHPDEPNPIDYVVQMLRTGDPNPHFFQKPSLYVYLLLSVLTAHFRWGLAQGRYAALDHMIITTHQYTTIPGFFFWGRMLTAAIAALTIVAAFRVARQVAGRAAGFVAALFLALAPFHLRHSQYVTTDMASAWLVLLVFGAALALAWHGRWRDYLAAGAFAGLAASAKYNAGVAALMVAAAHVLASPRHSLARAPRLLAAGGAAALGFVAGTPYALLSWAEFRGGLLGQVKDYAETAHGDFVGAWNIAGYADFFWSEGLGWLACLAVLAGLALLLARPGRQRAAGLIWLSFALPYLLLHLAQQSHFTRNMLPLVVLGALPLGVAFAAASAWAAGLSGRGKSAWQPARYLVPLALGAALLLPPALSSWAYTARLLRGDTRVQALAWIDEHVPPGVRVAAELRALPGPAESRWAEQAPLTRHDLAWYRSQGYGYLLASSDAWRQWPIPPAYTALAGAPLAEFGGATPRDMLGPHLAIYATGLAAGDAPLHIAGATVGGARLAGVALGQPDRAAGWLGLRTFWVVEQPFDRDFFIFVHLLDAAGNTVAQRDAPPWQGRFPTSSWRPGTVVVDINDVPLPAGLPAGTYTIALGMFDPASGAHPPIALAGRPADAIPAAQVTIR